MVEIALEVDKILNKRSLTTNTIPGDANCHSNQVRTSDTTIASTEKDGVPLVKGMKKKDGASRVKGRPKSCVEKKKKHKGTHKNSSLSQNFFSTMPIPTTQVLLA
ncbi:hypothetical protein RIF29_37975 [Crotalaria pallida]|uniref:Uncharacterized protein n=1 Tax=Crotalaria pallida TaxID=3830 RepID=A0AAN9DZA5_CROPI